jgi:phosphate:Na+ symporter
MKYLTILGALSLLLYSINSLSKLIEENSETKIKTILYKFTSTYISSFLCGIFICLITQSSSLVTILTIILISSKLINLDKGLCIVIGANIGTTITSFIITLDIGNYYYILFILSLFFIYIKKEELSSLFFILGIIFLSLDIFEKTMFSFFSNNYISSFFENTTSPLKGITLGTIFAFLTQSSSATIALTQKLYMNNLINGVLGCSIMLGANIGTTISGLIYSLKESVDAKKLVIASLLFNVFGVLFSIPFLYIYMNTINNLHFEYLISVSHIIFNIISGILGLFFIKPLCYITKFLVK